MSDPSPDDPDRRTFLKESALVASALAVGCRTDASGEAASLTSGDGRRLPAGLLRELARTVLPSELGDEGRERVVAGFEAWLAAYDPVPELVHGYGSQEIRYGPPDPAPAWKAQLEALELEAVKRSGTGFARLTTPARRALVARTLRAAPDRLPGRTGALEADTVTEGLLGWFYGSPEANDLCYSRAIARFGCWPLAASPDPPRPLDGAAPAS